MEYLFLMPRPLQNSRKALISNCNPLSDIREFGTPNLVMMFFHTNFLTSTSLILASASVSAHLVKYSIATNTNLLLPVAWGKGPRISSPHCANGQALLTGFSWPVGWWIRGACLWHCSYFRTYSAASFCIWGHQNP